MTAPATEKRCDCCDLPESMCGKAAERRLIEEQRRERAAAKPRHGATVEAKFAGRCKYGDEPVHVGQQLVYDEEYGWVCRGCADELDS